LFRSRLYSGNRPAGAAPMTPNLMFSIMNDVSLVAWILLAVLPRKRWVAGGLAKNAGTTNIASPPATQRFRGSTASRIHATSDTSFMIENIRFGVIGAAPAGRLSL